MPPRLVPPSELSDGDLAQWITQHYQNHGISSLNDVLDLGRVLTSEVAIAACLAVAASRPSQQSLPRIMPLVAKLSKLEPAPSAKSFSHALKWSTRLGLFPETYDILKAMERRDVPATPEVHFEVLHLYCYHGAKREAFELLATMGTTQAPKRTLLDATNVVMKKLPLSFPECQELFHQLTQKFRTWPSPLTWVCYCEAACRHTDEQPELFDCVIASMAGYRTVPTAQHYLLQLRSVAQAQGVQRARELARERGGEYIVALKNLEQEILQDSANLVSSASVA